MQLVGVKALHPRAATVPKMVVKLVAMSSLSCSSESPISSTFRSSNLFRKGVLI